MPNKAIEFAPGGRPTHKVQCTLFAAHRRRWASIMKGITAATVLLLLGWIGSAYSADALKSPRIRVELEVEVRTPKLKYKIVIDAEKQMTFRYDYLDGASGFSGVVSGSGLVDDVALLSLERVLSDQGFFNLPATLAYGVGQGAGSYRLRVEKDGNWREVRMLEGEKKAEAEWVRFFRVWEKVIDMCPAQPRVPPAALAWSQPNKRLHATAQSAAREQ